VDLLRSEDKASTFRFVRLPWVVVGRFAGSTMHGGSIRSNFPEHEEYADVQKRAGAGAQRPTLICGAINGISWKAEEPNGTPYETV